MLKVKVSELEQDVSDKSRAIDRLKDKVNYISNQKKALEQNSKSFGSQRSPTVANNLQRSETFVSPKSDEVVIIKQSTERFKHSESFQPQKDNLILDSPKA